MKKIENKKIYLYGNGVNYNEYEYIILFKSRRDQLDR